MSFILALAFLAFSSVFGAAEIHQEIPSGLSGRAINHAQGLTPTKSDEEARMFFDRHDPLIPAPQDSTASVAASEQSEQHGERDSQTRRPILKDQQCFKQAQAPIYINCFYDMTEFHDRLGRLQQYHDAKHAFDPDKPHAADMP